MNENNDKNFLRQCAKEVEELEFQLQESWKFEKDKNYHRYWWTLPKCTCPKMDNEDRFGTDYHVYSSDCPIHGINEEDKNAGLSESN